MPDPDAKEHFGNAGVGYEPIDANLRTVVRLGLVLLAFLGLTLAMIAGLYKILTLRSEGREQPLVSIQELHTLPPEPRLQASPASEWEKLQESQLDDLHGYGWVDQQAGVARIPIERAMELALKRGFPVRKSLTKP